MALQLALLSAVAAVTLHSALPSPESRHPNVGSATIFDACTAEMTSEVALQLVKSSNPREAGDGFDVEMHG